MVVKSLVFFVFFVFLLFLFFLVLSQPFFQKESQKRTREPENEKRLV